MKFFYFSSLSAAYVESFLIKVQFWQEAQQFYTRSSFEASVLKSISLYFKFPAIESSMISASFSVGTGIKLHVIGPKESMISTNFL